MSEQQVRSKSRVAAHGEVFTAEREVKAMCDLVKTETERIESRFLKPACGNGNFLTEVLSRKLAVVKKRYGKSPVDYQRYSVQAVMSLYGVELLPDNAAECRERLFALWEEEYIAAVKNRAEEPCREAVRYVLEKNILCGDAPTMCQTDGQPIVFAEWSFLSGNLVKRRDFTLDALLKPQQIQTTLDTAGWEYDAETESLIPKPICDTYLVVDYREVQEEKKHE